jgi:hypothetical protein
LAGIGMGRIENKLGRIENKLKSIIGNWNGYNWK